MGYIKDMKKKIITFSLIFLSLILFFLLKSKPSKNNGQNYKPPKNNDQNYKSINQNIIWYFGDKKIEFHYKKPPTKEEDNTLIFVIDESNLKDLFYDLDSHVVKIEPLNFANKNIFLLANKFYQSAGYTLYFAAILDLDNKKIIYKTGDLVKKGTFSDLQILNNGDVKISTFYPHYDYCRICAYSLADFLRYDGEKIISVNSFYQKEFKEIYQTFEKENGCYVVAGEKRLTFDEIKKQYGENYPCQASIKNITFSGATPKEYFFYKEKIERILKGEEVGVLD